MSLEPASHTSLSPTQFALRTGLIVSLTLSLFLLIVVPLEYLLTEQFLIVYTITPQQKTVLLMGLLAVVGFVMTRQTDKTLTTKHLVIANMIFGILLVANIFYNRYYQYLQTFPKIYNISSDWTIQGMAIRIRGKNFGDAWQAGKIKVDDLEFIINHWNNNEIVAQQPVPEKFFIGELKVIKFNGRESLGWPIEIRDPVFLQQ